MGCKKNPDVKKIKCVRPVAPADMSADQDFLCVRPYIKDIFWKEAENLNLRFDPLKISFTLTHHVLWSLNLILHVVLRNELLDTAWTKFRLEDRVRARDF